ncbi:unnamed protein product [Urochloa decumbens]|uniref:F-box domain-containing protein n=1 Tax=Urochloa decumbens TaxID=240449 RepID=A0ABC8W1L5_9POAL
MSQHEEEGLMRLLPDDVLADVLGRAVPRDVATARRVCRAWRALIDGRGLLRRDLVPRSLAGLFISYDGLHFPELFHRPSMEFAGPYMLPWSRPRGHCNGVLLLYDGLLNPAAQWWAPLPELPPGHFTNDMCLVFDPAVSPHCEVFLFPCSPHIRDNRRHVESGALPLLESEWPPSPFMLNVFSTVTGEWRERSFSREGASAGTVADMQKDQRWDGHPSVYWRGALYVYCEDKFVMRISLSNNTYQIIQPPCEIEMCEFHLGKSEKGVYCALSDDEGQLRVWILDESRSPIEWVLKHESGRGMSASRPDLSYFAHQVNGPWILSYANSRKGDDDIEALAQQESEWNSDDEDVLNTEDRDQNHQYIKSFGILGFHPYKEIIFLHKSVDRGFAYHLNTSKLERLGNICPIPYCNLDPYCCIQSCFPYTPCKMAELPSSGSQV